MEKVSHQIAPFQMSSQNGKSCVSFDLCWQFPFLCINHVYIIWNRCSLLWQQGFNYCFKCICQSVFFYDFGTLTMEMMTSNCPQDPWELSSMTIWSLDSGFWKAHFLFSVNQRPLVFSVHKAITNLTDNMWYENVTFPVSSLTKQGTLAWIYSCNF